MEEIEGKSGIIFKSNSQSIFSSNNNDLFITIKEDKVKIEIQYQTRDDTITLTEYMSTSDLKLLLEGTRHELDT